MDFGLWTLLIIFAISQIVINYGLYKAFRTSGKAQKDHVMFSIVTAAKDESGNIGKLVNALHRQDYPRDCFEVILVDDNSGDSTYESMQEHILDKEGFTAVKAHDKIYPAKKGALEAGIRNAKHPYILITDADCEPEPHWMRSFSAKFSEGYDVIFGRYAFYKTGTFVNSLSGFSSMRGSFLTFSAAALGMPYSAGASSFAFRKEAFDKIGGYRNTLQTLSGDDDLLIREAVKNNLKVGTVTVPGSIVRTSSKETFRDYLHQKARHTSTSDHYLPRHKFLLAFWHLINIVFLLSPLLCLISPIFILPFAIKLSADLITVMLQQKKFGYSFRWYEMIYLQFIYEIMLIVNYITASSGKKKNWK